MSDKGVFRIWSEYDWGLQDLVFTTKEKARNYITAMIEDDKEHFMYIVYGDDASTEDPIDCAMLEQDLLTIQWILLDPEY